MQSGRAGLSVIVRLRAASRKKLCMNLHEILPKVFHCHLEVTVAQQAHFGIKSTAAQKR